MISAAAQQVVADLERISCQPASRRLRVVAARQHPTAPVIGFPKATDINFRALDPLAAGTLNNIGDPTVPGLEHRNVKDLENEVIDVLAGLFRLPAGDRWGCVTTGGTEGNLHGLHLGRTRFPHAVVYFAASAHYSVPKAAHLLGLTAVRVPARPDGELDYDQLARALRRHPDRPAIVVATVGTTMTEAVDDVDAIAAALHDAGVPGHHLHVDAALTGIPLALLGHHPSVVLDGVVDSLSISGHKFLATPEPCGVLLTRRSHRDAVARTVSYIGGVDATISGSRSGHTVLQLWWALHTIDLAGHRQRAAAARDVAAYTTRRLTEAGWSAWRHDHAFTVVIDTPALELVKRWGLAPEGQISHIVCVPGVTTDIIDRFVADVCSVHRIALAAAVGKPA